MQSGERRVEVIADEGSIGRSMDLPALPADAVQEGLEAVVHDLVQLGVVERRAQASRQPFRPSRVLASAETGDAAERGLDLFHREANRAGELGIEEEEVGDAAGI